MANPRVLTKRRKAVRNIKKITRTMQLIATARFQAALTRATASKPYAEKITEIVQDLAAAGATISHPLLSEKPDAKRRALLVITSSRGFCGGYNSNLLRLAGEQIDAATGDDLPTDLIAVGKKGVNYFRFIKRPMAKAVPKFPDAPTFADSEAIAEELMAKFIDGEYADVRVVFMKFHTPAKQTAECVQILPIRRQLATTEPAPSKGRGEVQYDVSPPAEELLAELLPVTVKVSLFQCFLDAIVSEQVARMVAMKAATDAADEMIKQLSRQYNRARQSQITSELLDILGGAEALK